MCDSNVIVRTDDYEKKTMLFPREIFTGVFGERLLYSTSFIGLIDIIQ